MRDLTAYIDSLMNGDVTMSEKEWLAWIAKEEKDYNEKLTDEEKAHIISELEDAGLVTEEEDHGNFEVWCDNGQCGFVCASFDTKEEAIKKIAEWNEDGDAKYSLVGGGRK